MSIFNYTQSGGIIPACAGNRVKTTLYCCLIGDHPRVCGEQCLRPRSSYIAPGSSPRVRGTDGDEVEYEDTKWIIPACAGNSFCAVNCNVWYKGSSPRVRGTVRGAFEKWLVGGIIPACAGNRIKSRGRDPLPGDHPRVCGEQGLDMKKLNTLVGSSPRVRGTAQCNNLATRCVGIIPACAGNSVFC